MVAEGPAGLPVLEVRGLRAGYGRRVVLEDVTFTVQAGERVAVVGPNGAGKSTLFKCVARVLAPFAGTVTLRSPRPASAGGGRSRAAGPVVPVAYAPQREAVNWHFPATVYDVVMMGRFPFYGLWRPPSPADRRAVMGALGLVGMAEHVGAPVQSLSGGQQQRVFLARALAQEAGLVILDEPFNALEEGVQQALVEVLSRLKERGVALLLATHDLDLVAGTGWFDRVLVLNGRMLAYGPPEQVCRRRPAQEALAP